MKEIESWADLLSVLQAMTPEQLKQKAQFIETSPIDTERQALGQIIHIGTVEELFGDETTRSSYDNEHHPQDVVLLTDGNPFGEDGAIAEDLMTGERIFPGGVCR